MNAAIATAHNGTVASGVPSSRGRWRAPLHVFIGTLFTLLIVISGGAIGWHNYIQNRDLTIAAADNLFGAMARETRAELDAIRNPAELLIELLSHQRLGSATTLDERMAGVSFLAAALKRQPALSAVYAGYDDGAFFLLRRLAGTPVDDARFAPPAGAAFIVQSIERDNEGRARGAYVFLDAAAKVIARREAADYAFDPRTRIWYQQAREAGRQIRTAPYVFFTTREPGITLAQRSAMGPAVVGADVTLRAVSSALGRQSLTPSAETVVLGSDGTVFADRRFERIVRDDKGDAAPRLVNVSELGVPALAALMARLDPAKSQARHSLDVGNREWEASIARLGEAGSPRAAYLAVLAPRDELLGDAWRITRTSALLTLAIVIVCIPIAWLLSRRVSHSLHSLTGEARAVRRFDFSRPIATRSSIAEIGELAGTMDAMKRTIRQFLDIAATIAGERKFDRLLGHALEETLRATGSRAGAIYLVDEDGKLEQAAVHTLKSHGRATPVEKAALPDDHAIPLAIRDRHLVVERLSASIEERRRAFGPVASTLGHEPYVAVVIPLSNRQDAAVGALALFQDVSAGDPSPDLLAFAKALSGTIAVAIENQSLLQAQKALLEALIRLVAGAIDAKSPYTGGHCQRVPVLTKMLAEAACDAKTGPFRDFTMSDDEWEALHIATWLHDCGKVTTPEHVVDKATKLETIYNRLHEIRMRFEVMKRDADIDCWRRIAGGGDQEALLRERDARHRDLDAEFAFVAACNEGGESMATDAIERLRRIGERTWLRTLDDRIGLSQEERARKEKVAKAALPAIEQLLDDKPEHKIERTSDEQLPAGNRWGFRIEPPEHKSDLGELHNLSIGRGTLTAEDRYRINEHIVRTIMMLSELPFTGHLKCVPELAGGHHERMDGKGYPKGLSRDEMSVQARMMAIADVFEALTAADRPYKKAKTLSESIGIMARMRDEHHLDPDLFDLFLSAGIHRGYAARYLDPAQIDEVDVTAYVRAGAD